MPFRSLDADAQDEVADVDLGRAEHLGGGSADQEPCDAQEVVVNGLTDAGRPVLGRSFWFRGQRGGRHVNLQYPRERFYISNRHLRLMDKYSTNFLAAHPLQKTCST